MGTQDYSTGMAGMAGTTNIISLLCHEVLYEISCGSIFNGLNLECLIRFEEGDEARKPSKLSTKVS